MTTATSTASEPDIWNDPDGVWLEYDKTLYGPFKTEAEAKAEYRRLAS